MTMRDVHLGIDTAGPHLALALTTRDGAILARQAPRVDRRHAALIVPHLEALFEEAGVDRRRLARVTVGMGPGSYTGLRVGMATARGLVSALRCERTGGCSLATLAWGALQDGATGVAVMDARRGNVYAATFARTGGTLRVLEAPAKRPREVVQAAWPRATWIEDSAPDATWLAHHAASPGPVMLRYW